MPLNAGIEANGLGAFRRDLKRIDPELDKTLRDDLLAIGQEIASQAAGRVPRRSGRAAGSIRAGVSGKKAYVAGGKKTVPYYGWLDFGSRTPKRGQPRSTGPWAKSGAGPKKGRFIYPTIEDNRPKIEKKAVEAFEKAVDEALKRSY